MPREAAPDRTDDQLIRRTAEGDRSAFDTLVQRHQAAVFRLIRSLTTDNAVAEDALQETFLAAWRGAPGFRGESGVRTWLFAIARRALFRQFRRRVGEPDRLEPLEAWLALGEEAGWGRPPTPEQRAIRSETKQRLRAALDRLKPADRELLILVDLEGLTYEESAGVLGIGLAALKSRLHRARLRFAARLRREVGDAI